MPPDLPGDTIDLRADERLDETRLADYLRGRLPGAQGPNVPGGSGGPLTVRQFEGGAANLTYLLQYGPSEYVLRRPPLGPVAPSSHDMGREYRVLSVLHRAFPPAPRAFHLCEDASVIGARSGREGPVEDGQHAVLAAHVVGGGCDRPQGRPA